MALLDLYKVTRTLTDLLMYNITKTIEPSLDPAMAPPGSELQVTAIPPEKVENPSNQLNFYLYHVAEDAYYKNALGLGSDVPNVAKAPMALNLFYILTAHHEIGPEVDPQFGAEQQQRLMGYALKTFHDFPVITDQTRIAYVDDMGMPQEKVFLADTELAGKDNSIEVILRPVSPEDAIAFWGSEDTRTVRLSAYYEVRVILLEPEPPKTMPGVVLNLGTYLVQMGTPHLASSQSLVHFQLPARNGGTEQQIEAVPAQVTLNSAPSPAAGHNRLVLRGTNLSAGISRSLILKNSLWARLLPPDGLVEQTAVELTENPGWQIEFTSDRIEVTLTPTLTHVRPDGTTVDLPVLPGFYSTLVKSVSAERVINNELKQIVATSNEIGFAIAPRLVSHGPPDGNGNIPIEVGDEFDLLDENLTEDAIQVLVAGEVYTRVLDNPPANPREFRVATPNQVLINPHMPVDEAAVYPFRLTVNGAESAPFWLEFGS